MSLKIKFLERESIDQAISFFNHEMNDKPQLNNRRRDEFKWLFFDGVYKPSLYAVAMNTEEEEIVGTYAGIFIPMLSPSGKPVLTCKGEDTLLSLDRMIKLGKRDVLNEMLKSIEEKSKEDNVLFIWGFTAARNSFKRCGFNINNQVKGAFYVIKPIQFYKYRLQQFPRQSILKKTRLIGFSLYNYSRQLLSSLTFSQISLRQISFDEIEEEILLSFLPKNVFTIYLNKEYLKWRTSGNPSSMTYGFLEFKDKIGDIESYFIFSSNKENIYFVEQFLFRKDLNDNRKLKIMSSAFNFLKKQNATAIRAMGFTDNSLNIKEIYLLKKTGFYFFENRKASYFVLKYLTDPGINARDIYLSRLNTLGTV
jgi:hypothetical protein